LNASDINARKAILADRVFDGRLWHAHTAALIDGKRLRGLTDWESVPDTYRQHRLPPGGILTPGFIDLQVNGGGGILLNDSPTVEGMQTIARAHRARGTTSCLPTLITDTLETTQAAIAAATTAAGRYGVLGLHLEGPFINPARCGVHRRTHILRADESHLKLLGGLAVAGHSLVTLAPECVPQGFIRALTAAGLRVAAGHSEASATDMQRAIDEGLTGVTHLFNAMPPFSGRAPGIIGTALGEPRLIAGLIVDGLHVDPVSVRAAFAAKGSDGIALVSDAMPTIGAAADHFLLMGTLVHLRDGALRTEDGTLAGAHLDMVSAVGNAVRLAGIPLADALQSASLTPARFLGVEDERGALVPGVFADLVALSQDLEVIQTWVEGAEAINAD
jgi:N-acetylglucosamine-6-phosphate deacetylase